MTSKSTDKMEDCERVADKLPAIRPWTSITSLPTRDAAIEEAAKNEIRNLIYGLQYWNREAYVNFGGKDRPMPDWANRCYMSAVERIDRAHAFLFSTPTSGEASAPPPLSERLQTAFMAVQRAKREGHAGPGLQPIWDIVNAVPEIIEALGNRPASNGSDAVERIAVDLSDKIILRLGLDEDDPRLSAIIDELRAALASSPTTPSREGELREALKDAMEALAMCEPRTAHGASCQTAAILKARNLVEAGS